jgi:hypothetical protein
MTDELKQARKLPRRSSSEIALLANPARTSAPRMTLSCVDSSPPNVSNSPAVARLFSRLRSLRRCYLGWTFNGQS